MYRALIVVLLACGGKPAPKPAGPSPAQALAKQLDDDLAILAELAHRHTADCVGLATALRPHVDRMKAHAAEVQALLADPDLAKRRDFKTALTGYADKAPARTDQIANDMGAAYVGCTDQDAKYRLERAIADIPTFE